MTNTQPNLTAHILTLFPEMFPGPLAHSITGRALEQRLWACTPHNIRNHGLGKHKRVDDTPYGGGAGMLMRPDVVAEAIRTARSSIENLPANAPVIYLTPTGKKFTQDDAKKLSVHPHLFFLCGHYEGIDQRVIEAEVTHEFSIGDYVLTGGEIAVYPMLDAILRHIPNILGGETSLHEESFDVLDEDGTPLLEYPHYTRPPEWEGHNVPEVLTSGHHENIKNWRLEQAKQRTAKRHSR